MAERLCKNCDFFEPIEYEYGECRYSPPIVIEKLGTGYLFIPNQEGAGE